jgi:hypothetical protein
MHAQLVARRQVEPGEHHDLIARPQVLGILRDLLIEAIHARGAPSRWFGASSRTLKADCTHPIGTRP